MKIKELFTVPQGEKVTDRQLRRVLISTVCSVLLCMTCLVSTTWAWFTVSIENTGNEIWIGEPEICLTVGGAEYVSGTELSDTDIALNVVHANEADDLNRKSTLYVTLNIRSGDKTVTVCTTLEESRNYSAEVNIQNNTGKPCSITWAVSWFAPTNSMPVTEDTIVLEAAESTQSDTNDTTAGSETAAPETTAPATETPTEAPTEAATEAPTGAPTETATEATTQPSEEPATEPATTAAPEGES